MRLTLRLILSLTLAVTLSVVLFTAFQVEQERDRLLGELDRRAWARGEEFADEVVRRLATESRPELASQLSKIRNRERLAGIAVLGPDGSVLAASSVVANTLPAGMPVVEDAVRTGAPADATATLSGLRMRVHARPLIEAEKVSGVLVVLHESAYIDDHIAEVWRRNFLRLLVHALLIAAVSLAVVRATLLRPVRLMADWIRDLRTGAATAPPPVSPSELFAPLSREIDVLARSYRSARAAAEEEARLRDRAESIWTADRLKEHARARLLGRPLVVVSNREPYMHQREGKTVRWIMPASGLVTAVEPILRACGGTWIAHGSGSADRETSDDRGRLRVPPDHPQYDLRRVWLTKEDEAGYYYGFANEGLWPLCHIAHTRPLFRPSDWERYREVNGKFAEAVLEEIEGTSEPCVLIQDYHFALLPRLLKTRRPDARVAIFWHIPWPNPEAFGICPWQREILDGMLGADLVGFHTQFHCNNFLETVDRALESRIDWSHFTVDRNDHVTGVKPFPISVAFTGGAAPAPPGGEDPRAAVARVLGFDPPFLSVGVDRIDYTKGIPERFRAVERFLDKHPAYRGRFTHVAIGAPSRTTIPRYHDLNREVESEAARINAKFKDGPWRPIVLLARHHSHAEIEPFYRAANACLVSSLHDGMNLVAKEFVASRADERGALILSQFAGAARDMPDALIVNPYDVDRMAEAIRYALEMDAGEQQERMRRLRAGVRDRNVYRWAADLIADLAEIRVGRAGSTAT